MSKDSLALEKAALKKFSEVTQSSEGLLNKLFRGVAIVMVLILVLTVFSPIAIVGAGERGVKITFGQVEQGSLDEGLHFKIPIMQDIKILDVKTQKIETGASAASADLQIVSTTVALNYRIQPESAYLLYQEIGIAYQEKIIDPAIQESVKAVTANFTAEQLITQRSVVKANIEDNLRVRLAERHIQVQIVSITNFDFSEQFNKAIESKVTAEQQALKAERDLQRIKIEAEQRVTQAKAESDAKKLQADAEAYQKLELAKAQAFKIEAEGKAIAEALRLQREELSKELVDFKAIEKWDGVVPYFNGGGAIPFININREGT